MKNIFLNIDKKKFVIHFIGIGGSGMSGIAEFLFLSGYNITGSDVLYNLKINYLLSLGIKIFNNHSKSNILDVNLVVYSSAIKNDNVEIINAKFFGIPVISRIELLSEITKKYNLISVIGSHGKTTTTSFVFDLFFSHNIKLNCINGSNIKSINSSIYLSESNFFLLEVDESDKFFLCLNPFSVILTSIDSDHLNNYDFNINNLIDFFIFFLKKVPFYGYIIACVDDDIVKYILDNNFFNCKIITYGFRNYSIFNIDKFIQDKNRSFFTLYYKKKFCYDLILNFFGKYNVLNSVAAISFLYKFYKFDFFSLQKSLLDCKGVDRRSEVIGEFSFLYLKKSYNNILFLLDYGHHPTEINCVVEGIRNSWKNRRIIMIFQPHRYTRTKILFNEFVLVLSKLDILLLLDIYSANEDKSNFYIDSNTILNSMYDILNFKNCLFLNKKSLVIFYLLYLLKSNDIILFQGAGLVNLILFSFINNYIK